MDDSRLNTFAVPGWEQQANEFASLVRELANPANARVVPEIERRIQHIQREPAGWLIGFFSLIQDDLHVRFYGALTLTVKINSQWDSLKDVNEGPSVLLETLLSRYVHLTNASDHAVVLRKLASSLTAYCLQPAAEWESPVQSLLFELVQSQGGHVTDPGVVDHWQRAGNLSQSALRSLLWYCSTWIEEASKFDAKTAAGSKVYDKAARSQTDVWYLLHSMLQGIERRSRGSGEVVPDQIRKLSDQETVEIGREVIATALSWTKAAENLRDKSSDEVTYLQRETVQLVAGCCWLESFAEAALEYLSYVVESSPTFQHYIPKDVLKNIVQSPQVHTWLQTLATDGHASEGVKMATFIDAVVDLEDLSSPDWVQENSLEYVIPILHAFMQVPGIPGVDNAVASISLDVWTRIADGLGDWNGTSEADVIVRRELEKTIIETFPKTELPPEELDGENEFDPDERTKFNSFRRDFNDFLMACHTTVPDFVLGFVHQNLISALQNDNWALFETATFNLGALTEVTARDGSRDELYQNVFNSPKWQAICANQVAVPIKCRQAMVTLIAGCTKFLERHEEYLIVCMEFLFAGLADPNQTLQASEGIETLCNSRRSSLVPALPSFFAALNALDNIDLRQQKPIFASVAAIIQALPSEQAKLEPLKELLQVLFRQGARLDEMQRQQDEGTSSAAAAFLKSLAGIGRGLRYPDDGVIALDESPPQEAQFWMSGPGTDVQRMVLQALTQILQTFPSEEATGAACEVFKAGYTESDPFPFRFSPAISAQFLVPLIQKDAPSIEKILTTATSFLASHGENPGAIQDEFGQIISSITHIQRQLLDDSTAGRPWADHEFTYSSLDLVESVLLRYCASLLTLGNGPMSTIFEFALLCLRNPDTLPRRSATKFWATVFDLSGYNSRLGPEAASRWDQALQPIIPHFTTIVVQLIAGECARSEIEAVSTPLRRFVEKQGIPARNLLKTCIEDPNVLPAAAQANVTSVARQAFVQKLMGLRGTKKTDTIVREFWIACRGTNFAYTS